METNYLILIFLPVVCFLILFLLQQPFSLIKGEEIKAIIPITEAISLPFTGFSVRRGSLLITNYRLHVKTSTLFSFNIKGKTSDYSIFYNSNFQKKMERTIANLLSLSYVLKDYHYQAGKLILRVEPDLFKRVFELEDLNNENVLISFLKNYQKYETNKLD